MSSSCSRTATTPRATSAARRQRDLAEAQWNDDVHHCLHVILTGESDGYYGDYATNPHAMLCRCLAEGFGYQGETSPHEGGRPRGEPSAHLPPTAFVNFLQNHDQIGNRAFGERLHQAREGRSEPSLRATTILLLAPSIPMLFMGEEWAAPEPFTYFCDFEPELGAEGARRPQARVREVRAVRRRRRCERLPDPTDPATFEKREAATGARSISRAMPAGWSTIDGCSPFASATSCRSFPKITRGRCVKLQDSGALRRGLGDEQRQRAAPHREPQRPDGAARRQAVGPRDLCHPSRTFAEP